jgi:hypothetical protein
LLAGIAKDEFDRFSKALHLLNTMDQKKVAVFKASVKV